MSRDLLVMHPDRKVRYVAQGRTCATCKHSKPDRDGAWLYCQRDAPPTPALEPCEYHEKEQN